ncbi:MAG: hypothetical protein IJT18_07720 [Oscillospiraceae bacterium]|nr:hypothetical protein [Oscillospiraceae bacterium]
MGCYNLLTPQAAGEKAKRLFEEERRDQKVLNGWFLSREIADRATAGKTLSLEEKAITELEAVVRELPLHLSENAIFAGTERDAFAASYALINPAFTVENFKGYCDPLEVYDYATETPEIPRERIDRQKAAAGKSDYVKALNAVYAKCEKYTGEVVYFVEQVTGHVVPDFRPLLKDGVNGRIASLREKAQALPEGDERRGNYLCFARALETVKLLADRYRAIAEAQLNTADAQRKLELQRLIGALRRVPAEGARDLYEAMQSYLLLWQVMCIEQAPNPFAFSVGNADRIFEPYRQISGESREQAAALFKHFLVFYNVGERSWAISQNVILSGRDVAGNDLTNPMTYAILDAYFEMNLPQPILSVKLHKGTPDALKQSLGRFLFTPGVLTPSFFNDDSLFETLRESGIEEADLPDYSVAGCQEPLIMGKDSPNTTNSWLNLAKILEMTLADGKSLITGDVIGPVTGESTDSILKNLKARFYERLDLYAAAMRDSANGATRALSLLRTPLLSVGLGCDATGYDVRDAEHQGTKYSGSGCLIHGLSVVADSFVAVRHLLAEHPELAGDLLPALEKNFEGYDKLRAILKAAPKFGNNNDEADAEAAELAEKVSAVVSGLKNCLGAAFRPDWSSPSTHLLYGYWVGATPDGRSARDMLGYGLDPLYGDASAGMGYRTLSMLKLPYACMNGGSASHFGVDPKYFRGGTLEEKGMQFFERVIDPLFFNPIVKKRSPFYLYVNVTTAETLRKVLADPKKYAPNGVYIMRIHGTFVNFLDLSPAIQEDIIRRLDPGSTALC